jgi:hypothetical protein
MKKLGLINYEGDCLKALKDEDKVLIQDQYGETCKILTVEEFYGFLDGLFNIVDSRGKSWNFPSEHHEAKPSHSRIYHFMKSFSHTDVELMTAFTEGYELGEGRSSKDRLMEEYVIFLNRLKK